MSDQDRTTQPDRTDIDRTQRLLGERYQLNWIIGRGGMSTVWLARDTQAGRDVAVKILKPEYTDNEEFRTRFRNESQAAEQLHSINVVETYDYGEVRDGGAVFCYIIMEYVRGESLADVLNRERALPEALALDVLAQAALGLQAIHAAGMVHRDIKPGNLLITAEGIVKITDFGIAKAAAAVPLTRTGMVVGTAQYVSPEQAQGQAVGASSDVYSLGVVGYEMFAGQRLFTGESTVSVAIKHISTTPPPLPEHISAHMRELIEICLRKNPQMRYADGAELAAAIALVAEGQRPPQPHNVPDVDTDSHPLTEQLGTRAGQAALAKKATGPGTAVPPMQGPAQPAQPHPTQARQAQAHPAKPQQTKSTASAMLPLILGVIALLALGLAAYLWTTSSDEPAQDPTTTTITNEVTNEPTTQQTRATYVPPTPQQPTQAPQTTAEQPSNPATTVAPPTQPEATEPEVTSPRTPQPQPTNTANTQDTSGAVEGGEGIALPQADGPTAATTERPTSATG